MRYEKKKKNWEKKSNYIRNEIGLKKKKAVRNFCCNL